MIILTKENFKETVANTKGTLFIKFASKTGCQPCIDFRPRFERTANENPNLQFAMYERETLRGTPLDEIETEYKIDTFPTVLVFEDGVLGGKVSNYKFDSDRELAGRILDQQKKMYDVQCFLEDLQIEIQARGNKKPNPIDAPLPEPSQTPKAPVPEIVDPAEDVICDGCQ